MKPQIFVSYAHESRLSQSFIDIFELKIKDRNSALQNDQPIFNIWSDRDLKPGSEWQKKIDDAIADSFALIVLITPEAAKSHYVTYEWACAIGLKRVIIPVVLESSPGLHERIQSIQWADLSNKSTFPPEIDRLIKELEDQYQSLRKNDKIQESQRVAQLIFSSLDHSRKQREVGDTKNALQSLQSAVGSIAEFERMYEPIPLGETLNPLSDLIDDVYYELGRTYSLLGNDEKAELYFEKAIACNPDHIYSHINLGIMARKRADSIKQINSKEKKQYLESAYEYFEKALKLQEGILNYEEQSLWASLGGICKRQGRLEDAIIHYQKAIEYRKSSYPYNNLGLLYFELNQEEEMIANFRVGLSFAKAQLRIKPDDNWAPCDELVAQIVINQSGLDDEKLDSMKMERLIDHVMRVSPKILLQRIKNILEELVDHNEKYKKSKRDIIDLNAANSALKQVEAKLGTTSQKI